MLTVPVVAWIVLSVQWKHDGWCRLENYSRLSFPLYHPQPQVAYTGACKFECHVILYGLQLNRHI